MICDGTSQPGGQQLVRAEMGDESVPLESVESDRMKAPAASSDERQPDPGPMCCEMGNQEAENRTNG